jgi:hypothetical protein
VSGLIHAEPLTNSALLASTTKTNPGLFYPAKTAWKLQLLSFQDVLQVC